MGTDQGPEPSLGPFQGQNSCFRVERMLLLWGYDSPFHPEAIQ
jgi:hypothetical protein